MIDGWEIEAAIGPRTAALAYAPREGSHPPLAEIIDIGRRHRLPVIVDAAALVPPAENLHRFIDMGADLVCISGGKGLRGPQASGILCGRRELVASAILQMLDMAGEPFDAWDPPPGLIPKERLRGKPRHGIGRSAKVSKEAVVGLLVALEKFTAENFAEEARLRRELLAGIAKTIEDAPGINIGWEEDSSGGFPILVLDFTPAAAGPDAVRTAAAMREHGISLMEEYTSQGKLMIHSLNLTGSTADLIGRRLREVLSP